MTYQSFVLRFAQDDNRMTAHDGSTCQKAMTASHITSQNDGRAMKLSIVY